MNIVSTNIPYNSLILKKNITSLQNSYKFLSIDTIGKSVLNNDIYVIRLGNGPNNIFYSGSFHANEWITSVLLMHFVEEYCNSYVSNSSILGYSIPKLFNSTSIYIVPMVNPDGVDLINGNLSKNSIFYKNALKISKKFNNIPFPNRLEIKYSSAQT